MDIKLKATLSAYSKVSTISSDNTDSSIESVSKEQIDSLFSGEGDIETVTKEHIDTLFEEELEPVSHSDIDSLFN